MKEELKKKTCYVCKQLLPVDSFRSDSSKSGGRKSLCKTCQNAYHREYNKTHAHAMKRHVTNVHKSIAKYPHKQEARILLKRALKFGIISKKPCAVCGKEKVHGHHPDYSKPLEVIWLCPPHHVSLHYPKI